MVGHDQVDEPDDYSAAVGPRAIASQARLGGLDAVDVIDSVVRSGDHTEDGDDDEDNGEEGEEEDEGEEPEEEEGLTQGTGGTGTGTASAATSQALPGMTRPADTATSVDPDASSSATGRNPLVIGADGYDDVSIRSTGNRNIVTYDDSNVVIGGTVG